LNKNKDPVYDLVEVKQIIEVFTALSVFDLVSDDETSKQTKKSPHHNSSGHSIYCCIIVLQSRN
jgi:hypothetical protein